MTSDGIDKLARRLAEELPQGLKSVRDDLEKNFKSVLRTGLARLDLVTREEFEVQEAVLNRTREKLEALVARLDELESATTAVQSRGRKAAKRKTGKKTKKKTKKQAKKKAGKTRAKP